VRRHVHEQLLAVASELEIGAAAGR
jgi:hypothetical protein